MRTNQTGIDLIKHFEGFRSIPYYCPAGILTVGYGHTGPDVPGYLKTGITQEHAELLLRRDLATAEKAVTRLIPKPETQNQFSALVSFTYNLGAGALQRSSLRQKCLRCDWADAADEFLKWCKASGRVLPGLISRRKAERVLFLTHEEVIVSPIGKP